MSAKDELPTVHFGSDGVPDLRVGGRSMPYASLRMEVVDDVLHVDVGTLALDLSGEAPVTTFRVALFMGHDRQPEGTGTTLGDALRDLADKVPA